MMKTTSKSGAAKCNITGNAPIKNKIAKTIPANQTGWILNSILPILNKTFLYFLSCGFESEILVYPATITQRWILLNGEWFIKSMIRVETSSKMNGDALKPWPNPWVRVFRYMSSTVILSGLR